MNTSACLWDISLCLPSCQLKPNMAKAELSVSPLLSKPALLPPFSIAVDNASILPVTQAHNLSSSTHTSL